MEILSCIQQATKYVPVAIIVSVFGHVFIFLNFNFKLNMIVSHVLGNLCNISSRESTRVKSTFFKNNKVKNYRDRFHIRKDGKIYTKQHPISRSTQINIKSGTSLVQHSHVSPFRSYFRSLVVASCHPPYSTSAFARGPSQKSKINSREHTKIIMF